MCHSIEQSKHLFQTVAHRTDQVRALPYPLQPFERHPVVWRHLLDREWESTLFLNAKLHQKCDRHFGTFTGLNNDLIHETGLIYKLLHLIEYYLSAL